MKSNNETGFKCVYLTSSMIEKYEYRFVVKGRRYFKGGFATAEKASEAYVKAYKKTILKAYEK